LLQDDRFGSLFTNPDFGIDEQDENFRLRNPSGAAMARRRKNNLDSDEEDEGADDDDNAENDASGDDDNEYDDDRRVGYGDYEDDESGASESDDDVSIGVKVRGEAYESMKALERQAKEQRRGKSGNKDNSNNKKMSTKKVGSKGDIGKKSKVQLSAIEVDNPAKGLALGDILATERAKQRQEELDKPMVERLQEHKESGVLVQSTGGNKEFTYVPKDTKRRDDKGKGGDNGDRQSGKRQRRGVKDLKLKRVG
jgi:NUC153 domain